MSLTIDKVGYQKLLNECKSLTEFRDYRMYNYVLILFNTVLDFQMQSPSVRRAEDFFKQNHSKTIKSHADLKKLLAKFPNTNEGNKLLANYLWNNNHWSRAQFLRELVQYLESQNIGDFDSLKKWIQSVEFESIKGMIQARNSETGKVLHSIGPVLFDWLRLRLGEKAIKADVHVKKFVSGTLGYPLNHKDIVSILIKIAEDLKVEPRELDAAIWHHMSGY